MNKIGKGILTSTDLQDFCNDTNLRCIGVFSKDQLPNDKQVGSYYVNLQDHDKGDGTHWVMFKIFPNKEFFFFDAFGVYPPQQVKEFLEGHKERQIPFNTRDIQNSDDDHCGWYCLGCDYYTTHDYDKKKGVLDNFYDYINMFSDNKKINSRILMEYLDGQVG